MGQSPLVPQPVVGLLRKFGYAPRAEKFGRAAFRCRFLRNRLDPILTVFIERAILIRIRPGATRTIDSVKLVEMRKRGYPSHQPRFFEGKLRCFEDGLQPGRNAGRWSDPDALGLDGRLRMWQSATVGSLQSIDGNAAAESKFGFCHNSSHPRRPVYDRPPAPDRYRRLPPAAGAERGN